MWHPCPSVYIVFQSYRDARWFCWRGLLFCCLKHSENPVLGEASGSFHVVVPLGGAVNATTADGVTSLMTASQAGCTESVSVLVARGTPRNT